MCTVCTYVHTIDNNPSVIVGLCLAVIVVLR